MYQSWIDPTKTTHNFEYMWTLKKSCTAEIFSSEKLGSISFILTYSSMCDLCTFRPTCTCLCVCIVRSDSDPMDKSPPGFSVHGILQARILKWVPISFSRGIFPSQEWNPRVLCLLHWQVDSLPLRPRARPACIPSSNFLKDKIIINFSTKRI